jgi:hypothetical protein
MTRFLDPRPTSPVLPLDPNGMSINDAAQGGQLARPRPPAWLLEIEEPALIVDRGRFTAVNAPMAALLGLAEGALVHGALVDVFVEVQPDDTVLVRQPEGPVRARRRVSSLPVDGLRGECWVLSPVTPSRSAPAPADPGAPDLAALVGGIEDFAAELWELPRGSTLSACDVLRRLQTILDGDDHGLDEDETGAPTQTADLSEIVGRAYAELDPSAFRLGDDEGPLEVADPGAAAEIVAALFADALRTPGAILRLELRRDAAGWPTLIATTLNDDRPVVSNEALQAARKVVHAARGSLLELGAGRTLRLRLPPA